MRNHKIIVATLLSFLAVWWVVIPLLTYKQGTSTNISSTVVEEPFTTGDELVYRWSGDVVRSCPISIRREFVDSNGVVTRMVPMVFPALPASELGSTEYGVRVSVPILMAEGPAVYQATEIPSCNWIQKLRPISIDYPPIHFTVTR